VPYFRFRDASQSGLKGGITTVSSCWTRSGWRIASAVSPMAPLRGKSLFASAALESEMRWMRPAQDNRTAMCLKTEGGGAIVVGCASASIQIDPTTRWLRRASAGERMYPGAFQSRNREARSKVCQFHANLWLVQVDSR